MPICSHCNAKHINNRCSACKTVYYCNTYCQRKHWNKHKTECNLFTKIKTENQTSKKHNSNTAKYYCNEKSNWKQSLNNIDDKIKCIVSGYINQHEKTLQTNNEYHLFNQIPSLIQYICLSYYYIHSLNLYKTLSIKPNATMKEIKKAFRRKAMQLHPDRFDDKHRAKMELEFKDIQAAFEILKDAKKRKLYDKIGDQGLKYNPINLCSKVEFFNLFGTQEQKYCNEKSDWKRSLNEIDNKTKNIVFGYIHRYEKLINRNNEYKLFDQIPE
eukprot:516738_1